MRQAARARALEHFTWDSYRARLQEGYRRAVALNGTEATVDGLLIHFCLSRRDGFCFLIPGGGAFPFRFLRIPSGCWP